MAGEEWRRVFIGNGKASANEFYLNLNISLDRIPEQAIWKTEDGKRKLKMAVSKLRQPDQKGNTHSVQISYKEQPQQAEKPTYSGKAVEVGKLDSSTPNEGGNVPF